jgi:serine/threonine-protein kinase
MLEDDPTSPANEGKLVAGKYRIERVIGVGGMGVLMAAEHEGLHTKVAIKFLLPEMLGHKDIVARFTREAQAAVQIKNEHVAHILDVGTLESGAPYIVMEYLDGGDLAAWLQQRGPLPVEQAVDFVLQACVAMAEAHGLGIIHRDLKPANLFCIKRPDGQLSIKVLDFGISKMTGIADSAELSGTKTSTVMGSPFYMSPEQMRATKDADAQSDIWALGVILYELLTGKVPFDGKAATDLAIKVATEPPPAPRLLRPDVPPGLEAAILRCLEKNKRDRFQNVAELAVGLVEFAPKSARVSVERIRGTILSAGLSGAIAMPPSMQMPALQMASSPPAPPAITPSQPVGPAVTAEPVSDDVLASTARSRPRRVAPVIAAALVAMAVGGFLLLRSAHEPLAPSAMASPPPVDPSVSAPAVAPPPPVPAPVPSAAAAADPAAPSATPASSATPRHTDHGRGGHSPPTAPPPPGAAPATPHAASPSPAPPPKPASPLQMQPM